MKTATEIAMKLANDEHRALVRARLRGLLEQAFNAGFNTAERGITSEKYHEGQIDALLDIAVPPMASE